MNFQDGPNAKFAITQHFGYAKNENYKTFTEHCKKIFREMGFIKKLRITRKQFTKIIYGNLSRKH
jgi:CRISPR/Cas system-associated protein endoribonuclease Cas2